MKRFLKLLVGITAMCLIFTACNTNPQVDNNLNDANIQENQNIQSGKDNQNGESNNEAEVEEKVMIEPVNDIFDMDKALVSMESVIADTPLTKLTDSEIKEKYHFGKYMELEKLIASNETENSISEIAMVKLGDMEQSADILLMFIDRINDLKEKYADSTEIINLLTTQDNFIVKQQAGVAVMIIGEEAKTMEAEFNKTFQ